jgi:serine protease Do
MDSLIEHGRVIRGYVGVVPQPIDPEMAEFFGLEDTKGALISHVAEDSPADRAGFERGDVVVAFNGREVEDDNAFRRYAAEAEPGSKVEVKIIREGREKVLEVRMGERESSEQAPEEKLMEDRNPVFLGVALETLNNDHRQALNIPSRVKGVIITQLDRGAPAAEAGLVRGDVIVEVNRQRVRDIDDFRETIEDAGTRVLLLVYRGGSYFYAAISE